jgi:hypothetical protein
LVWVHPHSTAPDALLRYLGMIPDIDIWRAATLLIKQHGQDAEIVAARRVDELAEREDDEGRAVWLRIRRAIVELQTTPAGPGH